MDGLKRPIICSTHCAVNVINGDAGDAKFTNWFLLYTMEFLRAEPWAEECWLVWHTFSLYFMSTNVTLSIQWRLVKAINGAGGNEGKRSPRIDIMIYVFFSHIYVCFLPGKILFRRSHIRDVAMKRLGPINEYCRVSSLATALAVRSLHQLLPYCNLWKAGCQSREKKKQTLQ